MKDHHIYKSGKIYYASYVKCYNWVNVWKSVKISLLILELKEHRGWKSFGKKSIIQEYEINSLSHKGHNLNRDLLKHFYLFICIFLII